MSIDYSKFVVCLANGEDRLLEKLVEIRSELKVNFQIEVTGLHVGDIMVARSWSEGDGRERDWDQHLVDSNQNPDKMIPNLQPLMLIERKTISDFCSSFKSSHYANQKSRMIAFREQTGAKCFLVVEGYYDDRDLGPKVCGVPISTLEQCFTSIRVRDNFFVKHVENVYFHADFIFKCIKTMQKYKVWQGVQSSAELRKDFMESLKVRKKSNLDPRMCFVVQLSAIPDISVNMAEKISEVYPNMKSLINAFEKDGKFCLSEIKVGKNRFGKIKSEKIFNFLDLENNNARTKISLKKKI